jgi:hypothetical protein
MRTFDEIHTGIARLRRFVVEANPPIGTFSGDTQAHLEMLIEIQEALREYASLHLTMAPRIVARGYAEVK